MGRKALFLVLLLSALSRGAFASDEPLWEKYKAGFITRDGRVIDYSQHGTSHSEGQGYAMLLAVANNDRKTFDLVWQWTKANLKIRSDNLFAWQWGNRLKTNWEVIDVNNATDGDTLIAYALLKGYQRWPNDEYKREALNTVQALRTKLAVNWEGHTFLLPGYSGFVKENGIVLNPSYLIFPAFRLFSRFEQKEFWEKIYQDGIFLVSKCYFGNTALPADWVTVSQNGISLADGSNAYFGYEAIRLIFYLSLENNHQFVKGTEKMLDIYGKLGYIPLWVDVKNDGISLKPAPAGFYSIYGNVAKKMGKEALGRKLADEAKEKLNGEKDGYYSFTLYLLAENADQL